MTYKAMDLPVPFRPRALLAAYTGGIHFGDEVTCGDDIPFGDDVP